MWRPTTIFAVMLLAAGALAQASPARPAETARLVFVSAQSKGLVPLAQVLKELRRRYSGNQLDTKLIRSAPEVTLYEVQWLTAEGRKIVIIVNARDGKIVATRGLESDENTGR